MRILASCLAFAISAAACDGPAEPRGGTVAHVVMTARADSLGLGESASASATAVDSLWQRLASTISWTSSDPHVVTVDSAGLMTAVRPGAAWIRAHAGTAADSFRVSVITSHCDWMTFVNSSANGFWGTLILPGRTQNAETGSGTTEYHGIPMFWASGLLYATHPDTVVLGYDYTGRFMDFTGKSGICGGPDAPMHTVSLLRLDTQRPSRAPTDVRGLLVVQDQYAFAEPGNNDYLLFRYTFTNYGDTPIVNLRTGVVADFDLYSPRSNVGNYDPYVQVAYNMSNDSIANTLTAGVALIDSDVYVYYAPLEAAPTPTRAAYYDILANGRAVAERTPVQDVRQILAPRPVTLNPGASATLWYALVVGADRTSFMSNLAAARQRARLLNNTFSAAANARRMR